MMATMTMNDVRDDADAAQDDAGERLVVGVEEFLIARHDATLTLVSPRTGDHRTFRIRSIRGGDLDGKRVVELLTGLLNTDDFSGFGFVLDDGRIVTWKRFRGEGGERSQYERFADLLERPSHWAKKGVLYCIALKCRRCGRSLTRPDSIRDGLGEICRQKVGL